MNLIITLIAFAVTVVCIGYDQPIIALAGIAVLIWQEARGGDLA